MLENLLNNGINQILWLQDWGLWLKPVMQAFSFLGTEEFYLLIAPVLFWCVNTRLGLRVGIFLMISGGINLGFKLAFHSPRPYWYDPRVIAMSGETSFGLPSGHAQNAVAVWGTIASWFRRPWAWISAAGIIFFIGFSRMLLGVHFPIDVFTGWLIGAVLLWILIELEIPVTNLLKRWDLKRQLLVVFSASLILIIWGFLIRWLLNGWSIPETWIEFATITNPNQDPINPLSLEGLVTNAGALFGLSAGAVLLPRFGGFSAGGPAGQRVLRYLVGVVGVALLWFGLRVVFPSGDTLVAYVFRYIRYALVGLWVTGIAPLLFIKLNIASRNNT